VVDQVQAEAISSTGTLCILSQLSNGIYVFTSQSSSRATADEYLAQVEALFRDSENAPVLRCLIDTTKAPLSVKYVMPRYKALFTKYPNHPKVRAAMIMHNGLVSFISGIANLLDIQQTARSFGPGKYDAAVAWLLSDSK